MTEYGALPVLKKMPENGICMRDENGAYYQVRGQHAQVIVIGPMHFTPGEYVDALNEVVEDSFRLLHSAFMGTNNLDTRELVLRRGYVNLMASK